MTTGGELMRRTTLAVVLLLGVAPLCLNTSHATPIPKWMRQRTLESRILGSWRMIQGNGGAPSYTFIIRYKPKGVMEFYRKYNGGQERSNHGTYTIQNPDKTYPMGAINWSVDEFGTQRGEVSKITKLTDTHLTFVDPEGLVEEFERDKADEKR